MIRRYLTVVYDVTDLPQSEVDQLATEAVVQAESSDDYYEDEPGSGHRGVPEPTTWVTEQPLAGEHRGVRAWVAVGPHDDPELAGRYARVALHVEPGPSHLLDGIPTYSADIRIPS